MSTKATCDRCFELYPSTDMMTKKVMFKDPGRNGKVHRSRVVAWLCRSCLDRDPDWLREPRRGVNRNSFDTKVADK